MTTLTGKVGNDRTITINVKDSVGDAKDITGYSFLFWLGLNGTQKISKSLTITDATGGVASVSLTDTELNLPEERYNYYIHMTDDSSNNTTLVGGVFELLNRYDEDLSTSNTFTVTTSVSDSFTVTISASAGSANAFTDLTDTPSSLSGESLKFVRVNAGETALEFASSAASVVELGDVGDVTITSISSGEILKWDGSGWVNNTLAEAGISSGLTTPGTTTDKEIPIFSGTDGTAITNSAFIIDGNKIAIKSDTTTYIEYNSANSQWEFYVGGTMRGAF